MESPLVMTSDDILEMNEVPESPRNHRWWGCRYRTRPSIRDIWFKSNCYRNDGPYRCQLWMRKCLRIFVDLERKGMTILTGTKLQEIIEENGQLRIKVEGKDDIIANKALLSIGRVPDLEGIGDVEFEMDRGRIKVNEYMETSVPGIYAPGDINGTKSDARSLPYGEVAAENALKGNHAVS